MPGRGFSVATERDLVQLRVRTYDEASATTLSALGSQAVALPIHAVNSRLRAGALDGVLSSGDGAVGQSFGGTLSHFTAIRYAFPFSFVLVSEARYQALLPKLRQEVDEAAAASEQQQWTSLPARIEQNVAEMHRRGVAVNQDLSPSLRDEFVSVGEVRLKDWLARVPTDYAEIMTQFRAQKLSARRPCARILTPLTEASRCAAGSS